MTDNTIDNILKLSDSELTEYLSGLTVTELTEIFPYAPWKGKSQRRLVEWCIEDIKETQRFIRIQNKSTD